MAIVPNRGDSEIHLRKKGRLNELQMWRIETQEIKVSVAQLCLILCDPMDCMCSARLLCPWDSPGKNTGVCCYVTSSDKERKNLHSKLKKKKQSQEIIFSKQNVAKILKTNGVNRMQHVQNSFQNTYQESWCQSIESVSGSLSVVSDSLWLLF